MEYNSHLLSVVETKAEKEYVKALVDAYNSASLKIISEKEVHTKAFFVNLLSELKKELIYINEEFQKQLTENMEEIITIDSFATKAEYDLAVSYIGTQKKLYSLPKSTIKKLIDIKTMNFYRIDSKDNVLTSSLTADSMLKNIANNQYKKVRSVVLGEYAAGSTPTEIIKKIKPYMIDGAQANARTTVRTLLAEASQQSKNEFFDRNSDAIGEYLFVATLDSRTSSICRSLDGQRFEKRAPGITPALHPGCRSSLLAVPKGYTSKQRPIVLPDGTVEIVNDKGFTYTDAVKRFPELENRKLIDVEEYKKKIGYY